MNERKFGIAAIVMTALMFVFGILENIVFEANIFSVIMPLLFVATVVCGYFAFKDEVPFTSKWTWVALVILFAGALSSVADVFASIFVWELKVVGVLTNLLYTVGLVGVFASVFNNKLLKFMPIAFGVLALAELFTIFTGESSAVALLAIVLYALFAVMALNRFPRLNKLFRFIAVILALVCHMTSGIEMAVALIVLAFLLVPGIKRFKITFAYFVAILCLLVAVAAPFASFDSYIFEEAEYVSAEISDLKEELKSYKTIEEYEADIASYNSELTKLNAERTQLSTAYNLAEDALDEVCSWSSYWSYWCDDNTCKPFHDAADAAEDALNACDNKISDLEWDISVAENKIEELERLSDLRKQNVEVVLTLVFFVLATLLAMAGLVCLAIFLFKGKEGKLGLLSCGMLAVASLVHMLCTEVSAAYWTFNLIEYPIYNFIYSPYLWSILVSALFATILVKKEGKLVKFRVLAILSAVIMGVVAGAQGEAGVFAAYAVTAILTALCLVPLKFTEYQGIGKHIFLSIITLGVWSLIWIYNVTKNLNKVSGVETRKPLGQLLLCIFLPFYVVYWAYKTAEAVELYGAEKGKQFKISVLSLVFMFVCPLISTIIIQDKINQIVGKPE